VGLRGVVSRAQFQEIADMRKSDEVRRFDDACAFLRWEYFELWEVVVRVAIHKMQVGENG
jgi:hypothetical protein